MHDLKMKESKSILEKINNPFKAKLKALKSEFPNISKEDIANFFEYNGNEFEKTRALLNSTKKPKLDQFLKKLRTSYWDPDVEKYYSEMIEGVKLKKEVLTKEEESKENNKKEFKANLKLCNYNENFLMNIFTFFDPLTLTRISMVCKYFNEISQKAKLYKNFCIILHTIKIKLPERSVFEPLRDLILQNPGSYTQETRVCAMENIRSVVWLPALDSYKVSSNYYKGFNNWRSIFLLAPRIRFGGVYKLKEVYLKEGERRNNEIYIPVFRVEYHRYLRFLPNGLVFQIISTNSLSHQHLRELFIKAIEAMLTTDEYTFKMVIKKKEFEALKGEYLIKEDRLFIKFFKGKTLFEHGFKLLSSSPGAHDLLLEITHHMREVDTGFVTQLGKSQAQADKAYKFKQISEFINDMPPSPERNLGL